MAELLSALVVSSGADNDFEAGRGSLIPSCCAWRAAVEQAGLVFIEY